MLKSGEFVSPTLKVSSEQYILQKEEGTIPDNKAILGFVCVVVVIRDKVKENKYWWVQRESRSSATLNAADLIKKFIYEGTC